MDDRLQHAVARLTLLRAVGLVATVALSLAVIAAVLEEMVDPAFDGYRDALWWAVTTVTTVGYGDIVPESSAGRVVASVLMLIGVSAIPIATSLVVTVFATRLQAEQREQDKAERDEVFARLERIEQALVRQYPAE